MPLSRIGVFMLFFIGLSGCMVSPPPVYVAPPKTVVVAEPVLVAPPVLVTRPAVRRVIIY